MLSDTVGFIKKLPHQLVASFHATLEEALNADLLFVVVEGPNGEAVEHLRTVENVLEHLGADHIPRIFVINKMDRVDDMSVLTPIYAYGGTSCPISAKTGDGVDGLLCKVQEYLASYEQRVQILVPHAAGALHAEIRSAATVLSEFYTEEGCLMELQVSPTMLGRILAKGAIVSGSNPE